MIKRVKENWYYLVLAGSILLLLFLNVFYLQNWIDSDMSAEMIFSKLLSEENNLFAFSNWYYSTEFRVLYTQLVMVPLFKICSNWYVIRLVTNCVFYGLLLISYFYFMKPFRFKRKYVVLSAAVLLLPFSETLMTHMQMGNTYMSHVIIIFFLAGMFLRLAFYEQLKKSRKIELLCIYIALSIICGMSGVRYMLALQCPLVLTAFFFMFGGNEWKKLRETVNKENWKALFTSARCRYFLYGIVSLVACAAGYFINAIWISKKFVFQTYESIDFIQVYDGVLMERIQRAIGSFLMLFGYIPEKSVLSVRGLISIIAFILIAVIIYAVIRTGKVKNEIEKFIWLFFMITFSLNTFVFIFTNSTLVPRYYITVMIFALPVMCIYFKNEEHLIDRYMVGILLAACLLLSTFKMSASFVSNDKNAGRRDVVEFLQDNGYSFGYATYWNANIITELSNGTVEVANLYKAESMSLFKWSTPMKYYDEEYAKGPVFLILEKAEVEECVKPQLLEAGELVYDNGAYVIYHYVDNAGFDEGYGE